MRGNKLLWLATAFLVALSEISSSGQNLSATGPNSPAMSAGSTNESVQTNPPAANRGYILVPDDLVEIGVYQQPDLETKARLDQDGRITMPLLGTLTIGGKTVDQARGMIRELLDKDYLVNPQVSLTIVEYAKRVFTILGEVQRPGTYEIQGESSLSLLQAIGLAGGYTRLSAPSKIIVERIQNGQKKVYNLNADSMSKDEKTKPFEILPNDTITVGESLL
jgi:polysaccharide export outer membrane protein